MDALIVNLKEMIIKVVECAWKQKHLTMASSLPFLGKRMARYSKTDKYTCIHQLSPHMFSYLNCIVDQGILFQINSIWKIESLMEVGQKLMMFITNFNVHHAGNLLQTAHPSSSSTLTAETFLEFDCDAALTSAKFVKI